MAHIRPPKRLDIHYNEYLSNNNQQDQHQPTTTHLREVVLFPQRARRSEYFYEHPGGEQIYILLHDLDAIRAEFD